MSSELPEFPPYLYGTAWKEDETRRLTRLAIQQGFRGIDTANQRKHYFEAAVGEGLAGVVVSLRVVALGVVSHEIGRAESWARPWRLMKVRAGAGHRNLQGRLLQT